MSKSLGKGSGFSHGPEKSKLMASTECIVQDVSQLVSDTENIMGFGLIINSGWSIDLNVTEMIAVECISVTVCV